MICPTRSPLSRECRRACHQEILLPAMETTVAAHRSFSQAAARNGESCGRGAGTGVHEAHAQASQATPRIGFFLVSSSNDMSWAVGE